MAVVFVKGKVTPSDIKKAQEEYGRYIKVVVDVEKELMAIGGEWHADAEKILLENGAKQGSIWGGGIDIDTNNIETIALINLRPGSNNSQEILDANTRDKFVKMVEGKFGL